MLFLSYNFSFMARNWFNFNLKELYYEFCLYLAFFLEKLNYVTENLNAILTVTFWVSNRINVLITKVVALQQTYQLVGDTVQLTTYMWLSFCATDCIIWL